MPSATFFNLPPAKREKLLAAAPGRICPGPLCPGLGQPDHPWGGDSPGQLLHVFRRQRGTVPLSDGRLRHAAHPPDGTPAGRTERSGIRRVSGPVRLRTGPPGGIPGSAEHPPAQRRYAPGLFPANAGGACRRACGSGWTSRGWTCGRRATWKPSSTSSFSSPEAP